METSVIYTKNLDYLRKGVRIIENRGGQYSGKTVGILAALATLCAEERDGITTVTSMSFPHLKAGALSDFESYVYPDFKSAIKSYHKTDHLFTFKSGSKLQFKVFENEMTARGPKRKRLFVNEANKMDRMTWFQLNSRSEQSVIDYNPSVRFWAHDEVTGSPNTKLIMSDHRHNPFLSDAKHKEIETICTFSYNSDGTVKRNSKGEPVVLKGSYELWKVYARGITGNVTGVIFPNWEMIDDSDYPEDEEDVFSIDFGYTNDPTAIIKHCRKADTLFVKEIGYETGLPPKIIKRILVNNGFNLSSSVLYCEHDPDMIRALRNLGIVNALPARKGQGSLNAGIELLNSFKVKYTSSSKNMHREKGLYVWVVDEKTGKLTNIPIDRDNHSFDAFRYGAYTKYLKNQS